MRGLVVPEPTEDFTADPVELFFDLAFVLAFSQLVYLLVHDPTWTGAGEATLLFMVIWVAWSTFTWSANAVSGNRREVRALFLIATAASVPMGASVTRAFDTGGATFAISGAIIVLMALGLQLWGLSPDSDEFRSVIRYSGPNLLAIALLVIGGLVDTPARSVVWCLMVVVIIGAMIAAGSGDWIVRSGHFAERHGLIIIIALGELIVAIGISVVESLSGADGLPDQTIVGMAAAGILAGLLWWSYFDRVLPALEHKSESLTGRDRGRFTRDAYTWLHAPIVGGIIATASAAEEILLHPKDQVPTEFRVMMAVGLVLFLGGITVAAARAYGVLARERTLSAIAIVLLLIFTSGWQGLTLLIAIDVILLIGLVVEHLRIEHPNEAETAETSMSETR